MSDALIDAEPEIRAIIARTEKLRALLRPDGQRQLSVVIATQHALGADVFPRVFGRLVDRRPEVSWRLRTLDGDDCVSLFERGDADLLLCYEARRFPPLPFDTTIHRHVIGRDTLIPVIGGSLRHRAREDMALSDGVPVLTYPEDSHFGTLLARTGLSDALPRRSPPGRAVESAFSVVLLELVGRGAGVAWLPYTMCRDQLASGDLVSLAGAYGSVPLEITLFALDTQRIAIGLLKDILSRLTLSGSAPPPARPPRSGPRARRP